MVLNDRCVTPHNSQLNSLEKVKRNGSKCQKRCGETLMKKLSNRTALIKILENSGEDGSCTIFSDSCSTLLDLKLSAVVFLTAEENKAAVNCAEAKT